MRDLLTLMEQLRDPQAGCPWDIEQTHDSLVPFLIEECYELVEAIQQGDIANIQEELGDVLFQLVFHAQIQRENNHFDFADVVEGIVTKMKRRHPHVYAGAVFRNEAEREAAWQAIKREEKAGKAKISDRQLDEATFFTVSKAMPVLTRAEKLQKAAAKTGFDWPSYDPIVAKIEEELHEVVEVIENNEGKKRLVEEMGDLLFAVTNLARHLGVDSESALVNGNSKFERRFTSVVKRLKQRGINAEDATLEQMDLVWDEVKEAERLSGL